MEISRLLRYTIDMLIFLLRLLDSGNLTYDNFKSHVDIKLVFLKNNLEKIESLKERLIATQILGICDKILAN